MKVSLAVVLSVAMALSACDYTPQKSAAPKADAPSAAAPVTAAAPQPSIETLAEFPHGTFLENLTIGPDGAVTFTSYFDKTLMRLIGPGPAATFAKLDVHPVCIVPVKDGYVVTAQGKAFTEGAGFTSSNVVLALDSLGAVKSRTPAPKALFLNGAAVDASGKVLIADSLAGVIWRFDPSTGTIAQWIEAGELKPDPAAKGFALGANGLKIQKGSVYVSNTSRGTLYTIAMGPNGQPDSGVEFVAQTGNIDDFAFADDGSIYVATHQSAIKRVTPGGLVETFLEKGCDGCTSLAVWGEDNAQRLIVLSTGNWGEPDDKTPARVLSVAIPAKN